MNYLIVVIVIFLSSFAYADSVDIDSVINTLRNPFESRLPLVVAPISPVAPQDNGGSANLFQNQQSNWNNMSNNINQVVDRLPEVIEKPNVSIEGLVWSDTIQSVIMAGHVLNVGDSLNDMKIKSVSREGVKVVYKGKEFLYEIK